eukprot:2722681-Rhodomonas_salina.2
MQCPTPRTDPSTVKSTGISTVRASDPSTDPDASTDLGPRADTDPSTGPDPSTDGAYDATSWYSVCGTDGAYGATSWYKGSAAVCYSPAPQVSQLWAHAYTPAYHLLKVHMIRRLFLVNYGPMAILVPFKYFVLRVHLDCCPVLKRFASVVLRLMVPSYRCSY